MKPTYKWLHLVLAAIISSALITACGNDDEPEGGDSAVGNWVGLSYYNNPVGGVKQQELYVSFNANNTGDLEFRGSTQTSFAYFTYKQKKNIISCSGAYASTSGSLETDFEMDFKLKDGRLYPCSKYTQFILSRDGSIITDADGNEISSNSSDLEGVWIREGGYDIMYFYPNGKTYEEYILEEPGSKSYTTHLVGTYSYDPILKALYIGSTKWDVNVLTSTTLSISNKSSKITYTFTKGSYSDLPDSKDTRSILISGKYWSTGKGSGNIQYAFYSSGKCTKKISSSKTYGSYGPALVMANGTFSVNSAGLVTVNYTDISIEPFTAVKDYPEWPVGGTKTEKFTISILDFSAYRSIRLDYTDGKTLTVSAEGI